MPSTTSVTDEADSLVQRLVEDMGRRWRAGERPRAEEYLARWPEIGAQPAAALELIYEEFCLRREHGEEVAAEEVYRRFPQWQSELAVLLDCHRVLAPSVAAPRFPAAGEVLGDFRLRAELGRGAAGRVFLGTQPALADRPVVLKLVPLAGREHLTLARLQHTHIVPLYEVQDDAGRGLRVLCMPYFGGLTLSQLLHALRGRPPARRTGEDLREALRQASQAAPVPLPAAGLAAEELAGPSYSRAVCWIGACLAEALHHAHRRGLVHLDLKPSNVLLAADGQPMLLDFHLARAPVRAGGPPPEWLGGTPAYMAPEQDAALAAVRAGQPVTADVDGRADIYSLGLLLYEALGGTLPAPARSPGRALRRHNPRVSMGLGDIIERALAADPGRRYPTAATLAEDLRRHLAYLPLRGVANRNPLERLRKRRQRQPFVLALSSLLLTVLVGGGWAILHFNQQSEKARAALEEGRERLGQRQYGEARAALRRGLDLAGALPFQGRLTDELSGQMRLAQRGEAADFLHRVAEQVRPLYGTDEVPPAARSAVVAQCRLLWERRGEIVERLTPSPDSARAEQVQADMLDVVLVWTDLRVRTRGERAPAARRDALAILEQAEALFGPSCVLDRERRDCAAALGEKPPPAAAPPAREPTPWEHYALGRALLRAGELAEAEQHLELARDMEPPSPWPHYHHGQCVYRRHRPADAVADFTVCVSLVPGSARCFYNRALVFTDLGDVKHALHDYERALKLDPDLAPAALNLGMLHYQLKDYDKALENLARARDLGAARAVVAYDLALVHHARGDRAAALDCAREALARDPGHRDARALLDSLLGGPEDR
jgi:serine/threonine protein kinase/Flp pilus assembly protein TadD